MQVLCLLGTLTHCLDNSAALRAFASVAQALRPGGIVVLELAHPGKRLVLPLHARVGGWLVSAL